MTRNYFLCFVLCTTSTSYHGRASCIQHNLLPMRPFLVPCSRGLRKPGCRGGRGSAATTTSHLAYLGLFWHFQNGITDFCSMSVSKVSFVKMFYFIRLSEDRRRGSREDILGYPMIPRYPRISHDIRYQDIRVYQGIPGYPRISGDTRISEDIRI